MPLQIHQETGDDTVFEIRTNGSCSTASSLDDEPETELTLDNGSQEVNDLYEVRDFTDVNVYFLSVDTDPQPAMTEREAAPLGGLAEPHFTALARKEVDDIFFPIAEELWFSLPFTTAGGAARTEAVLLPGLASGTLPAQFRVRLRGWTDCFEEGLEDHETHVSVENDSFETLVLPDPGNVNVGLFDGDHIFVHDVGWTHSGGDPLLTPTVHVSLSAVATVCPADNGNNYGFPFFADVILDSVEVDYQRTFHTDTDLLTFDYPDGDADFEVTGFTSDTVEGLRGSPI